MPSPTLSPVSVRVSASERDLLETAAGLARTSLSDFVRRKAVEAAELDVLERRVVTIASADWERFEAWLHEPPKEVSALRDLAVSRPAWQE